MDQGGEEMQFLSPYMELVVKPHHSISSREKIMTKDDFESYSKSNCSL